MQRSTEQKNKKLELLLQFYFHFTSNLCGCFKSQPDCSGVTLDVDFLQAGLFLFVQKNSRLFLETAFLLNGPKHNEILRLNNRLSMLTTHMNIGALPVQYAASDSSTELPLK